MRWWAEKSQRLLIFVIFECRCWEIEGSLAARTWRWCTYIQSWPGCVIDPPCLSGLGWGFQGNSWHLDRCSRVPGRRNLGPGTVTHQECGKQITLFKELKQFVTCQSGKLLSFKVGKFINYNEPCQCISITIRILAPVAQLVTSISPLCKCRKSPACA